jgi:FkbM family methyltransferase
MKKLIQGLANRCGYRISRLSPPTKADPAFAAMQCLATGIKEPIIFDVGAHCGVVSKTFREMFPTSTIYSFEPFNESFEQLKANTVSDPRLNAFNFGLSDRAGVQSFHSNRSSATNSLLSTDKLGSQTWGPGLLDTQKIIQAQFKTIDSVVETLRIPRIDILKLDVQGAEHLVISGASAACSRGIIRLIYSEIITQPTYKDQKRFDEALAAFYNSGFDLYNIYNMTHTVEGRLCQVDAIFTKTVG